MDPFRVIFARDGAAVGCEDDEEVRVGDYEDEGGAGHGDGDCEQAGCGVCYFTVLPMSLLRKSNESCRNELSPHAGELISEKSSHDFTHPPGSPNLFIEIQTQDHCMDLMILRLTRSSGI